MGLPASMRYLNFTAFLRERPFGLPLTPGLNLVASREVAYSYDCELPVRMLLMWGFNPREEVPWVSSSPSTRLHLPTPLCSVARRITVPA